MTSSSRKKAPSPGGAGADAASFLHVFAFRSKPDRFGAGADDDGVGMMGFFFDRDGKGRVLGSTNRRSCRALRDEQLACPEFHHHLGTTDALRIAGNFDVQGIT